MIDYPWWFDCWSWCGVSMRGLSLAPDSSHHFWNRSDRGLAWSRVGIGFQPSAAARHHCDHGVQLFTRPVASHWEAKFDSCHFVSPLFIHYVCAWNHRCHSPSMFFYSLTMRYHDLHPCVRSMLDLNLLCHRICQPWLRLPLNQCQDGGVHAGTPRSPRTPLKNHHLRLS